MKFIYGLLSIILLIKANNATATSTDTLHVIVKMEEIKYATDFEKLAFEDFFLNKKEKYF